MGVYLFFLVTFKIILLLFLGIYFIIKSKYALQAYQQSVYNNRRYWNYIKDNYKYSFGINELLVILIFLLFFGAGKLENPFFYLLKYFLSIVVAYYNLKFFNISKKRYVEKVPFKLTQRVRRLIFTLSIVSFMVFVILWMNINFFVSLVLVIYFIYLWIMISNIINTPVEKLIYNKFKKKAAEKLKGYEELTVIGVTGSYGKTSIKNIIFDVLSSNEITLMTPASYNTPMGVSLTINNELNKMYENFIVEMGAYYEGEIYELCHMVHPSIGVVSSIGPQHLETFKSLENIQKTKMELIESLPIDGLGVLNYDNEYIRNYSIRNKVLIKWYSLENENVDLYAYDVKYLDDGMTFKIKFSGEYFEVQTSLLGKHSVYNILASILVADFKGIEIDNIIEAILRIRPIKNRLEFKRISNNLTIIDDSFNGNIEGMIEGINILKKYSNKKILITPGIIDGGDDNFKLNEEIGSNVVGIDLLIIIGKYNKKALCKLVDRNVEIKEFDNFIDGYNYAILDEVDKTILIANDLPDKYNG